MRTMFPYQQARCMVEIFRSGTKQRNNFILGMMIRGAPVVHRSLKASSIPSLCSRTSSGVFPMWYFMAWCGIFRVSEICLKVVTKEEEPLELLGPSLMDLRAAGATILRGRGILCTSSKRQDGDYRDDLCHLATTRASHTETGHRPGSSGWKERTPPKSA